MTRLSQFSCNPILFSFSVHSTQVTVAVHRIPNQPSQLVSGGSVVLFCTITTAISNSIVQVQWYNGTQEIQETLSVHITQFYKLLNGIWHSSLEMSVLTFHTSWYYCEATDNNETVQYGSIQLFVEDSSKIDYVNTRVYAFVVN